MQHVTTQDWSSSLYWTTTKIVPVLMADRLVLRCPEPSDFSDYAAFMASDRAKHLGGPYCDTEAWTMFCRDAAQWLFFGHGALMIDTLEGRCVGQVGLNAGPPFPQPELGWLLYAGCEGQGFAYEAAAELLKWAHETFNFPGLVSFIHPENHRSRRLAERLGAKLDPQASAALPSDLVYRHNVSAEAVG